MAVKIMVMVSELDIAGIINVKICSSPNIVPVEVLFTPRRE